MTAEEERERRALVEEALSWQRTPFHDCAAVKGAGVDCANLLYEAAHNVKLVHTYTIPQYTPQFLLHSSRELFLEIVEQFCRPVIDRLPLPGDMKMYRFGKCFSHAVIVIDYPRVIHATKAAGMVTQADAEMDMDLKWFREKPRPSRLYTLKQWS